MLIGKEEKAHSKYSENLWHCVFNFLFHYKYSNKFVTIIHFSMLIFGKGKFNMARFPISATGSPLNIIRCEMTATYFRKIQDKLLKDELDALVDPFQFSQPDFFNSYKNARNIVDYSGRGKAAPVTPVTNPV